MGMLPDRAALWVLFLPGEGTLVTEGRVVKLGQEFVTLLPRCRLLFALSCRLISPFN
jgi:hypothetical protein